MFRPRSLANGDIVKDFVLIETIDGGLDLLILVENNPSKQTRLQIHEYPSE